MDREEKVKVKEEERNPYRKGEGNSKFIEMVVERCFEKGNGLMFRLFDIGNLSFTGQKLFVYKNNVGSIVRRFANGIRNGEDVDKMFNEMREEMEKVVKLACDDGGEKGRVFMEKVDRELKLYRMFVDSLKGGKQ